MQWELYQRFSAERNPPARLPYPAPVRVALLSGGALVAWGGAFWLVRGLLQAIA